MASYIFHTDIDVACLQFGHAGASIYAHLHWRVCQLLLDAVQHRYVVCKDNHLATWHSATCLLNMLHMAAAAVELLQNQFWLLHPVALCNNV